MLGCRQYSAAKVLCVQSTNQLAAVFVRPAKLVAGSSYTRQLASAARRAGGHPPRVIPVKKAVLAVMSQPNEELDALLTKMLPSIRDTVAWQTTWIAEEADVTALEKHDGLPVVVLWKTYDKPSVLALRALWLTHGSRVRWVHSWSSGVDSLVPLLSELDAKSRVPITNLKGAFSSSLAEWSLASILYFNKELPRLVANNTSQKRDPFAMQELKGMTVGFVGFGSIAQATAKLCRTFGMRTIAVRKSGGRHPLASEITSAEAVFAAADFVICSLPATPDTQGFCSKELVSSMKPSAVFISIGSAATIDTQAILEALHSKRIAGVALDVVEKKQLPSSVSEHNPSLLIRSPHFTPIGNPRAGELFKAQLSNFSSGQPFDDVVDRGAGY